MAAKKSGFGSKLLHNAGIFNPVLVQAVGLCPVIAMATTLKGAALLALVATVTITLSEFIASAFLKVIPRWVRTGIYIIMGGGIVTPFMVLLERVNPELFGSLGIYLPIMAVNSLLVLRCERFGVKLKPLAALTDGFTASVGYSAVLILVGILREFLGSGSIAGFKLFKNMAIPGLLLPFGGFLMIGFAAAALRAFISAYFPKYLDKKQPKPGKKQKHKAVSPAPAIILPDLTPEEDPFTFDEIAAQTEEIFEEEMQTVSYTELEQAEPYSETEKPEIQPKQPEATTYPAPVEEQEATEPVLDIQPEIAVESEVEVEPKPKYEPEHIKFKELTYEEAIDSASEKHEPIASEPAPKASQAEPIQAKKHWNVPSFDADDEELTRLMNRSIDEVFRKHKEDESE